MSKKLLLINGPNLNLLGTREPEVYGSETLKDVEERVNTLVSKYDIQLLPFQSNHEGQIIDVIHEHRNADYLIINPGGLTHSSVALRDAILGVELPFIEVHISNIHARENFRHHSYLSDVASGVIVGCGVYGYTLASQLVITKLCK
ncbi:MAG: 3-dehydroquinate dehydratase-2 [bacterium]|jgi:3-dehydroquinate dehydratase-2